MIFVCARIFFVQTDALRVREFFFIGAFSPRLCVCDAAKVQTYPHDALRALQRISAPLLVAYEGRQSA